MPASMLSTRSPFTMVFADLFGEMGRSALDLSQGPLTCEIFMHDDRYVVEVDVPGVTKDQVKVAVRNGHVTVEIERPEPTDAGQRIYSNRPKSGSVRRVVVFRDLADDGHEANLANGVLVLTLPKRKSAQECEIPVR